MDLLHINQWLVELFLMLLYVLLLAYTFLVLLRKEVFIVPLFCFFFGVAASLVQAFWLQSLQLAVPWWVLIVGTVLYTGLAVYAGKKAHRVENIFNFVKEGEEEEE